MDDVFLFFFTAGDYLVYFFTSVSLHLAVFFIFLPFSSRNCKFISQFRFLLRFSLYHNCELACHNFFTFSQKC